jgi:hypothetical protein
MTDFRFPSPGGPVACTIAAPGVLMSVSRADTRKEPPMPTFKLPLSGDVVQSINPFTAFMTGGQFGLININLGQSSEPKVEEEVLSDVATYGKQLGRIGDALIVLLEHFHPRQPLTAEETKAIDALKTMLDKIADVKEKYKRPAIRPSAIAPNS